MTASAPLPRFLSVRSPHRTERAVLRTAANGLHRRPHVFVGRDEIPPGLKERAGVDFAPFVDQLRGAGGAIVDREAPGDVAVPLHHGVRAAERVRLFRVERRVDTPEHDPGPAFARDPANLVAAQSVARMDSYPNNVALPDRRRIQLLERFVSDERVTEGPRSRRGKHVKPPGCNDPHTEGKMARVYQVHLH